MGCRGRRPRLPAGVAKGKGHEIGIVVSGKNRIRDSSKYSGELTSPPITETFAYKLHCLGEDLHLSDQVRSQAPECGSSLPLFSAQLAGRRLYCFGREQTRWVKAAASCRTPKLLTNCCTDCH
jgi:hypothetical protein